MGGQKKYSSSLDTPSDPNEEEYNFIKETIKHRPFNRRKFFQWAASVAVGAVAFGILSGFVFRLTVPVVEKYQEKDRGQEQKVKIPKDEPEETGKHKKDSTPTPRLWRCPKISHWLTMKRFTTRFSVWQKNPAERWFRYRGCVANRICWITAGFLLASRKGLSSKITGAGCIF